MGFIYGNNGDYFTRFGSQTHVNDKGGHETYQEFGNRTYDNHGQSMTTFGNMSQLSNGKTIQKFGDRYYVGGKTYTKFGNMLYGPNGQHWYGSNMTDSDIRNIIMHDNT